MKRRDFLAGLGGAALTACSGDPRRFTGTIGEVELRPSPRVREIRSDFVGLSYESSLLTDPQFLSAENTALVNLIAGLGHSGVLRIGGNSSEFIEWRGPEHETMQPPRPPLRTVITAGDVDRLAGLVQATGWRVVYGLNLANGDPERAADHAAYVKQRLGASLYAFQIGNEPDLYARAGLRPSSYGVADYIREWQQFAQVIRARAGDVRLAGPDVAYTAEWIDAFAQACGSQVEFLSDHFYAIGPPSNPEADIPALLRSDVERYPKLRNGVDGVLSYGKPVLITEGNSCWEGGKARVSDTMASALWATNLLFNCASDGMSGFCFHGGAGGFYTPLAKAEHGGGTVARPLYYGMRLFAEAGAGRLMDVRINSLNRGLRGYALQGVDGSTTLALLNLGQAQATDVRVGIKGRKLTGGSVLRLSAPTLFSTSQISLGAAQVDELGHLALREETMALDPNNHTGLVTVSAASAVLLRLN